LHALSFSDQQGKCIHQLPTGWRKVQTPRCLWRTGGSGTERRSSVIEIIPDLVPIVPAEGPRADMAMPGHAREVMSDQAAHHASCAMCARAWNSMVA